MDFNSPARKKRRRSMLIEKQVATTNDTSVLDNAPTRIENPKVMEYCAKLKEEKNKWKNYEKLLHKEYLKMKRSGESEVLNTSHYLNDLPVEDKIYLQNWKENKKEFEHLNEVTLPDLVEKLQLLSFEFNKQVCLRSLKHSNFDLLIRKSNEIICEENENLASRLL